MGPVTTPLAVLASLLCYSLLVTSPHATPIPVEEDVGNDETRFHALTEEQLLTTDPEVNMDAEQLATSKGYPFEKHTVETADGFLLGMHRIPHSVNGPDGKRPPIFLQHGILDSSETWMLNLRETSLAFILSDAGYDVWLGNSRGNTYSRKHKSLKPSQKEFWEWSWDEMAEYDVPANINYITKHTGAKKIPVAAHSQGGTQFFAALLSNSTVASKISVFAGLAPVSYISHTQSGLIYLVSKLGADKLVQLLGVNEFLPSSKILKELFPTTCKLFPTLCESVIYLFAGLDAPNLNATRLPVYMGHFPHGCSVQDIAHYAQMVRSGNFEKYDFGKAGNQKHYGSDEPPQYDPANWPLNVKLMMFIGGNDDLADPDDAMRFFDQLPSGVEKKFSNTLNYAHLDFNWGEDSRKRIYDPMIEWIQQHTNNVMEQVQ